MRKYFVSVHYLVKSAIRDGRLVRQSKCSECDSSHGVVAHHDDYSKPLDIRWLCRKCHVKWHALNGAGENRWRANLNPRPTRKDQFPRNSEMLALAAEGRSYVEIGEQFGLSRERVRQVLGNMEIGRRRKEALDSSAAQILKLRLGGSTLSEISLATGVPLAWVRTLKDLPDKPPVPIPHGTWGGYTHHKCRCEQCKAANNARTKMRNERLRSEGKCILCREPSKAWYCDNCKPVYERKGRKAGISGERGIVYQRSSNQWGVIRYIGGKQKYYGGFKDIEDAKRRNAEIGWD